MKKKTTSAKRIMLAVMITVPMLSLILWGHNTGVAAKTQDTYKSLEIFSNVLSIIQKNYVIFHSIVIQPFSHMNLHIFYIVCIVEQNTFLLQKVAIDYL